MKKILVLGLILLFAFSLLTACGKSGGGSSGNNGDPAGKTDGMLNPPAWLIGDWVTTDPTENIKVTERNVVLSSGNLDMTWQMKNVGLKVEETTDGNVYRLAYSAAGMDFSYTFTSQEGGGMTCRTGVGGVGVVAAYTKK